MMDIASKRNFCIIAHVDHGKSTLADRLLQITGTIQTRQMREQVLDAHELERERGITIRAHPVTMRYLADNGKQYELNLIDTPGHVDFSYEVSRSLASCEGALLVIDASQGVEAQTVANAHLAMKLNLVLIPVINKIDLPNADVDAARNQLEEVLAIPADQAILASGKTGEGVEKILEAIIKRIPSPDARSDEPLRALIFASVFDQFRGVEPYVRIVSGELRKGQRILLMSTGTEHEVEEVGVFRPQQEPCDVLATGDVGYFAAHIKSLAEVRIGETVTDARRAAVIPLPGFQEARPMVFSGIYPLDSGDYERLKSSLAKLQLNDPAFSFVTESSVALGFGFRCGFLGLLHMEVVQERLRREYHLDLIATYPSVSYRLTKTNGEVVMVENPALLPPETEIAKFEEPVIRAFIICPNEKIGDVIQLVQEKRGECTRTESLDTRRVLLTCSLPLNEVLVDFNDKLKSITRGYGSMDYEPAGYREADLVKLEMLVNGDPVDAFSCIVERGKAEGRGRALAAKLKEVIPQQLYQVAIQAAIGGKIIARENVKALRKDVTAKCYGGDITRKRKLLERQKEGKKRMKQIGKVHIPQEAFIEVLKTG